MLTIHPATDRPTWHSNCMIMDTVLSLMYGTPKQHTEPHRKRADNPYAISND